MSKISYIITTDILADILLVSASLEFPITFQALYVFCFFLSLDCQIYYHIVNFLLIQLDNCVEVILFFSAETITAIIKWSKTIQNRRNTTTIG